MRASVLVLGLALGCGKQAAAPPAAGSVSGSPVAVAVAIDAAAPAARDAAAIDAPLAKLSDADRETIGGFALGASSDEVVKALGAPRSKSKEETMAATGETISTWNFNGLAITMAKQDQSYVVNAIGLKAPSPAATSRGIHIGSTRADVEASYVHGKGETGADAERFLVGSPFGGELFTFKAGVVTEIFLGAMAE
jgi:hypothetical protein